VNGSKCVSGFIELTVDDQHDNHTNNAIHNLHSNIASQILFIKKED
jgi:hypothetical protein